MKTCKNPQCVDGEVAVTKMRINIPCPDCQSQEPPFEGVGGGELPPDFKCVVCPERGEIINKHGWRICSTCGVSYGLQKTHELKLPKGQEPAETSEFVCHRYSVSNTGMVYLDCDGDLCLWKAVKPICDRLEAAEKENEKWMTKMEERNAWYDKAIDLMKKCNELTKRAEELEDKLSLSDRPHGMEPENCPTFYDGCNCTVEALVHNIKRAETAEEEIERLKEWINQLESAAIVERDDIRRRKFTAIKKGLTLSQALSKS